MDIAAAWARLQAQLRAIIYFLMGDWKHLGDNHWVNKVIQENIRGGNRKPMGRSRGAQKEALRVSLC